jgi:phage terminase Nu1 subunit (DNA packaging protein)
MQLNREKLAEFFGCSLRTIDEYRRRGMPGEAPERPGNQWKFDTAAAIEWLRQRERQSALREIAAEAITANGESNGTLREAQRQEAWIKVQKAGLMLSRERAELAPIGEINAWVAGMIIRAREILTLIAPRLKDQLAQQSNPHECERLVAGEIHRALNELAEFPTQTKSSQVQ